MSIAQAFCVSIVLCWLGGTLFPLIIHIWINDLRPCIPWVSGCIGFLEVGISDPGSYFYRGFLIPGSMILMGWYLAMGRWLEALTSDKRSQWIPWLGMLVSVCSVAAVSLLRPEMEEIIWPWILGIALALLVTQCILHGLILSIANRAQVSPNSLGWTVKNWVFRFQVLLAVILTANYFFDFGGAAALKGMEWWYVAATVLFFFISYSQWKNYHL
ncbi:MAG: hypothetical protein ACPGYX_00575, partial [Oceanobacter sp.]